MEENAQPFEIPADKLVFNHQSEKSMQENAHLFEMPADKLEFNHQSLRESRELGQATIVTGFRGKARIRIDGEERATLWPWALAAVLLIAALGAAWQFKVWPFEQPAPPSEPKLINAPQTKPDNSPPVAVAVPPEPQPSSGTLIIPSQSGNNGGDIPAPEVKKPADPKPHAATSPKRDTAAHQAASPAKKTSHANKASTTPAKPADAAPAAAHVSESHVSAQQGAKANTPPAESTQAPPTTGQPAKTATNQGPTNTASP